MGIYLIKASLIWCVFLILFLLLFRRSGQFRLNRLFLLTGIISGAILPLITIPVLWVSDSSEPPGELKNILHNFQNFQVAGNTGIAAAAPLMNWPQIISLLYCTGAAVFLLFQVREVLAINAIAAEGTWKQKQGYRFCSTSGRHAPFSFMGRIFIAWPEQYEALELDYILQHETAHNRGKHWLDLLIIQFLLVIFWFHPLLWIYRYFLKQEHEYEADAIASGGRAYEYGHFLLKQVLLQGAPSMAHSFYFSPIKNRIAMLASNRKTNKWKYLAAVPALLSCGLLMARPASDIRKSRSGNVTEYKGSKFYWEEVAVDSVAIRDSVTGKTNWVLVRPSSDIIKVNKDTVQHGNLGDFSADRRGIHDYYIKEFRKRAKALPKGVDGLELNNFVISAGGRVIYYDAYWREGGQYREVTDPYFTGLINTITEESPDWSFNQEGKRPVYVRAGLHIPFKPGVAGSTFPAE